jgi:hypothetical protein
VLFTHAKPRLLRIYFHSVELWTDAGSYDAEFYDQALR